MPETFPQHFRNAVEQNRGSRKEAVVFHEEEGSSHLMINGNISGLKEYILENLDKLYSTKIEKGKIINQEIVDYISEISNKINREINVAIDRNGNIIDISIGDSSTVNLPVVSW